jgi:hypothetical protein
MSVKCKPYLMSMLALKGNYCLAILRMGCSLTRTRWISCSLLSLSILLGILQNGLLPLLDPGEIVAVFWAWAWCVAFLKMGCSFTWPRWNSYCTICWDWACCLAFLRMGCLSLTWPRWNSYNLLSLCMLLGIPQNGLLCYLTQVK